MAFTSFKVHVCIVATSEEKNIIAALDILLQKVSAIVLLNVSVKHGIKCIISIVLKSVTCVIEEDKNCNAI